MGEFVTIGTSGDGAGFTAYRADPAARPKAAIVVIQEIFGVNAGIRKKADDWAALGYLAVAPDMFWRFAPGYDVDPDVPAQAQDAVELRKKFDTDKGVGDVKATICWLRGELGPDAKIGLVGFCLGGRIAYLAAARTDIDASVGYYGGGIDAALSEARGIARPLLLHFAEHDHFITAEARAIIHVALDNHPHVTICDYADVDHGFATTSGKRRDDAAAELADRRTRKFFAEHLS